MNKYSIAGSIYETTVPQLIQALSGPEWTIQDDGDEIKLRTDDIFLEIYDFAPYGKAREYLLGGTIYHDRERTASLVNILADRLRALGIAYTIEVNEDRGPMVLELNFYGSPA